MITGTNTNIKILKTEVSESTANITLLFYAISATVPPKSFQFYLEEDDSTDKELISNNTYFVDKANNLTNVSSYVDINKYKEVIINVDISRGETAQIVDQHWVRRFRLCLYNAQTHQKAWESEELIFQSASFNLPIVESLHPKTLTRETILNPGTIIQSIEKHYHISTDVYLYAKDDTDFNAATRNYDVLVQLYYNDASLPFEEIKFSSDTSTDNKKFTLESLTEFDLNDRVIVKAIVATKDGRIISQKTALFSVWPHEGEVYIKVNGEVKEVLAIYMKDAIEEGTDLWV